MAKHTEAGVVFYTSELLDRAGIKHGFFTRLGGISTGQFESLNFKNRIGDKPQHVAENRRRACESIGVDATRLVFLNDLAHGNSVLNIEKPHEEFNNHDGLITAVKGISLSLSVADCMPILLADIKHQAVAIVHAGWRGLVAGIIETAVNDMVKLGVRFSDIIAAVGPSNGPDTYEFGEDYLPQIQAVFPADLIVHMKGGKIFVDLWKASQIKLQNCGISKIDLLGINNFTNADEFYSYRRDDKNTGRNGTVICL